ncbi:hypothetical protein SprV_0100460100 [Sparganum proliferum]
METVQFTGGMVLTELLKPKESKSPGPGEIPAKILKELADELAKPLSMLFHTSLETGYLPADWKSAWITPLYMAEVGNETGVNPSALQPFEDTTIMETFQFTEGMVLTELLKPKESKSPGPGEIPAKILKELADELAKPLSMLFHTSLETGYLPADWKSAWITPLYMAEVGNETGVNPSALQPFEDTTIMETFQFTEGMVLTELLKPKESKSPGPGEIPAKILKELADELAKPLSMLFHTSLETGYLPADWKSAWITPLYMAEVGSL